MPRVGQPRPHDSPVARRNRLAPVAGDQVRHQQETVGQPPLRVAQDKAFLVGADRRADHLGRDRQILPLELAHQHDRPFDQPRDFVEQPLVLDQVEPMRQRQRFGVGQDDRLAPLGVEHHARALQRGNIILETAHLDRPRREKTMAVGDIARGDPIERERHDIGRLMRTAEGAENCAQRPHPAQRVGPGRTRAPAHRFLPGERAQDRRQNLGDQLRRRAAGPLDHRDIDLAFLAVGHFPRLIEVLQPRAFQKPRDRRLRRPDARPFALLAPVGLGGGQPDHMQRQPSRRRKTLRAFVGQAGLDQRVRDEPL